MIGLYFSGTGNTKHCEENKILVTGLPDYSDNGFIRGEGLIPRGSAAQYVDFYGKSQSYKNKPNINIEKCIGCGLCVKNCPTIENFPVYLYSFIKWQKLF